MHHIQRKIFAKLMYADTLSYGQLRPAGVESNHFAYHLEQLMREGLVAKKDRGTYRLTPTGLALADRVNHERIEAHMQPSIITAIDIVNDSGQMLVFTHNFRPYRGLSGFVQGRLHFGERVHDAALRELHEKTGLTDIPLTHRGMAYVRTKFGDDYVSILLVHVFSGSVTGTPPTAPVTKGTSAWTSTSELTERRCMPGFLEIKKLLHESSAGELFFAEIEDQNHSLDS